MAIKIIHFDSEAEANAFITGVTWVNDSSIYWRSAEYNAMGVKLTLEDNDTESDEIAKTTVELVVETTIHKTVKGIVKAKCWSDDHRVEVDFNAEPFFIQASEADILELAQVDWGLDYPADEVARTLDGKNSDITKMFQYIQAADIGFECRIEEESAWSWLKQHRPELFSSDSSLQKFYNEKFLGK